jgi:hypothetical protein
MPKVTSEMELSRVLELERELQTRTCRNNRARVLELLAPDFTEVGASGHVWDLTSTLEMLASEPEDEEEIQVIELSGRIIADGFILARWDSLHGGRRARRTSLWRREEDGWRLVHHQGTLLLG